MVYEAKSFSRVAPRKNTRINRNVLSFAITKSANESVVATVFGHVEFVKILKVVFAAVYL